MIAERQQGTAGEEVLRRVVRRPPASTISPGATSRPSAAATRSLPSATPAVEKSTTTGPSRRPASPTRTGWCRAHGRSRRTGRPPRPIAERHPHQPGRRQFCDVLAQPPTWLQSRIVTAATACSPASPAAVRVASWAAGWPKPHPPSTTAAACWRRTTAAAERHSQDLAVSDPGRVLGQPDHAVRVMPDEVGQDERPGHLAQAVAGGAPSPVSACCARVGSARRRGERGPKGPCLLRSITRHLLTVISFS